MEIFLSGATNEIIELSSTDLSWTRQVSPLISITSAKSFEPETITRIAASSGVRSNSTLNFFNEKTLSDDKPYLTRMSSRVISSSRMVGGSKFKLIFARSASSILVIGQVHQSGVIQ